MLAEHGVQPGDRVALIMPNVAYFPIAYYAILRSGAVVVPMNPLLKAGEIAYAWGDAGAKVAVVFALFAEEAAKAAQTTGTDVIVVGAGRVREAARRRRADRRAWWSGAAEDTAVILYTSGTTGNPKGAELSHNNLRTNAITSVETLMPSGPGSVIFGGLPLFHSFGQTCAMNCAMYSGACMTLLPKFDPETALQICADDRVNIFLGVPTMYMGAALGARQGPVRHLAPRGLRRPAAPPCRWRCCTASRRRSASRSWRGTDCRRPLRSRRSTTRTWAPSPARSAPRSAGCEFDLRDLDDKPVADGEIGEIVIRGENVMKGYWNRPEATAEAIRDGWFHSGDLAPATPTATTRSSTARRT